MKKTQVWAIKLYLNCCHLSSLSLHRLLCPSSPPVTQGTALLSVAFLLGVDQRHESGTTAKGNQQPQPRAAPAPPWWGHGDRTPQIPAGVTGHPPNAWGPHHPATAGATAPGLAGHGQHKPPSVPYWDTFLKKRHIHKKKEKQKNKKTEKSGKKGKKWSP